MAKVQITTEVRSEGKIHTTVAHDCGPDLIQAAATLIHGLESVLVELDEKIKEIQGAAPAPKKEPGLIVPASARQRLAVERSTRRQRK